MTVKQFKLVFKLAKAMKCSTILIMSNMLIGTTTYDDITTSIVDTGIVKSPLYQITIEDLNSIFDFLGTTENEVEDVELYINHVCYKGIEQNNILAIYNRCISRLFNI